MWRWKIEKKLFIQSRHSSACSLMWILHIHLMIYLAECRTTLWHVRVCRGSTDPILGSGEGTCQRGLYLAWTKDMVHALSICYTVLNRWKFHDFTIWNVLLLHSFLDLAERMHWNPTGIQGVTVDQWKPVHPLGTLCMKTRRDTLAWLGECWSRGPALMYPARMAGSSWPHLRRILRYNSLRCWSNMELSSHNRVSIHFIRNWAPYWLVI